MQVTLTFNMQELPDELKQAVFKLMDFTVTKVSEPEQTYPTKEFKERVKEVKETRTTKTNEPTMSGGPSFAEVKKIMLTKVASHKDEIIDWIRTEGEADKLSNVEPKRYQAFIDFVQSLS